MSDRGLPQDRVRCVVALRRLTDQRRQVGFADGHWTAYSRLIAAAKYRRAISPTEQVHHINGDPTDDRFENLTLVSVREHAFIHEAERTAGTRLRFVDHRCASCGVAVNQRTKACETCTTRHYMRRYRRQEVAA